MQRTTVETQVTGQRNVLYWCGVTVILGLLSGCDWTPKLSHPKAPSRETATRVALHTAFVSVIAEYSREKRGVSESLVATPAQFKFVRSMYVNTNIDTWYHELELGKDVDVAAVNMECADGTSKWMLFKMLNGHLNQLDGDSRRLHAILDSEDWVQVNIDRENKVKERQRVD